MSRGAGAHAGPWGGWRQPLLLLGACIALAGLLAGCGAGRIRPLRPADVDPAFVDVPGFESARLGWVETGHERYDTFFREAASLQGALLLAERAAAGALELDGVEPLLEGLPARAAALEAEGETLLARARSDFAHDEAKAVMIGPALHEALGQVRDAARRSPALLQALRCLPGENRVVADRCP